MSEAGAIPVAGTNIFNLNQNIMIYEFVTMSDPITFVAPDDKIAFLVCLFLGEGKAGCKREDGQSVNTMTAFIFNQEGRNEVYRKYCGTDDLDTCFKENVAGVADALLSFCYGSIEARRSYDDAIAAITDPEKLSDFKAKHEDRNRSSLSQWVKAAWQYGEQLKETLKTE